MEVTSRHHLRSDDVSALRERIDALFGVDLAGEAYESVAFADADRELVLVDGEPLVLQLAEGPVLSVRGANVVEPTRGVVVVDAGAVQFVSDGADVMRPGIVDADETIEAGDPVLIAEETHGKVLAIGRARTDGTDLLGEQGKVIDTLHHVGDELYGFMG